MNQFKYSLDNKRYHTYNYYLKNKYHQKVAKVALNADFTCPNRDGTKGYGGCIFCSSSGSGDYAGNVHDHLEKQFQTISQVMKRKWPECASGFCSQPWLVCAASSENHSVPAVAGCRSSAQAVFAGVVPLACRCWCSSRRHI